MDKVNTLKECVNKITKDAYKFFEKNNADIILESIRLLPKALNLAN